eukprot:10603414-Alexandrium_andersonii.AAC.1
MCIRDSAQTVRGRPIFRWRLDQAVLGTMTCVSALQALDDPRLCHFDLDVDGGGDGLSALPGEPCCIQRGPTNIAEVLELPKWMWERVGLFHQKRAQGLLAKGLA